jgi:hypothetical protein
VDLLHSTSLLDVDGVAVQVVGLGGLVHLTDLENVLKTVKSNLDDLVVHAGKKVAKGTDTSLVDEVTDLLRLGETTRGGVGDSPTGLLAGLEVSVSEEVDKGRNDVGVNDGLDLSGVSSSNVGDGPACLLADSVLRRREKRQQGGEGTAVNDDLGLDVVTSDNVSNGTESGGLDGGRRVHQELDETTRDTGLDDGLDLIVGSVGKVRDGPAGIDEDLIVERVYELSQNGKSGKDLYVMVNTMTFVISAAQLTVFQSGWGVFPRQKLERVQVAFLNMESLRLSPRRDNNGGRAPADKT